MAVHQYMYIFYYIFFDWPLAISAATRYMYLLPRPVAPSAQGSKEKKRKGLTFASPFLFFLSSSKCNVDLHKLVIYGEARRRRTRVNTQLAIDRGQVGIDGAAGDDQVVGNLGVGQPLGQ